MDSFSLVKCVAHFFVVVTTLHHASFVLTLDFVDGFGELEDGSLYGLLKCRVPVELHVLYGEDLSLNIIARKCLVNMPFHFSFIGLLLRLHIHFSSENFQTAFCSN